MKGYIQIYTGNGKGKTTAALGGLSLRAAAAGKKVFIGQFVKGMHYSELDLIPALPGISLKQYGRDALLIQNRLRKILSRRNRGGSTR